MNLTEPARTTEIFGTRTLVAQGVYLGTDM